MTRQILMPFTLLIAASLALTGCKTVETVQARVEDGYLNVRQALQDFRPFSPSTLASIETAAGAASAPPEPGSLNACPTVRIVQDLDRVHQFIDGANPDLGQAVSSIRMTNVQDTCTTVDNSLAIDMTIAFEGNVGPKGRAQPSDKPSFAYPYFIAITNNQGSIVAKEVFAVTLAYGSGRNSETHVEQVRQIIPMVEMNQKNYKVLIGFQLSEQELAYNRSLPPEQETAESSNAVAVIEPAVGTTSD